MIVTRTNNEPLVSIKSVGVDITGLDTDIALALPRLAYLWKAFFPKDADGLTITSGCEGNRTDKVHKMASLHYKENSPSGKGRAIDIRVNDVPSATDVMKFVSCASMLLGDEYDVIHEGNHIHLEFDTI